MKSLENNRDIMIRGKGMLLISETEPTDFLLSAIEERNG